MSENRKPTIKYSLTVQTESTDERVARRLERLSMSDEQKQNMQVGRITPIRDDDELIDERIPLRAKATYHFEMAVRGTLDAKDAEIARLREALHALLARDPHYDDHTMEDYCAYCGGDEHTPDCAYMKAREALGEADE